MAEKSGVNELTVRLEAFPPEDGELELELGAVVAGGVVVGDVVFLLELQAEANSPRLRARVRPPTFINLRFTTPFLLNDGARVGRCGCHMDAITDHEQGGAVIFSRCPPGT
jgi:hypothetical protein